MLALGLSACENDNVAPDADLIAGKQAFVGKCGVCHVLGRADTTGTRGPSLDDAFSRALSDGFGRDTLRGVVYRQILHPARLSKDDAAFMPPKLVEGKVAKDVAAYVASAVALQGRDAGRLGAAVPTAGAGKPVAAKHGKLQLPADPSGRLAYVTRVARAPAGRLVIDSKNESSTPHNIAIEGHGVDKRGKVVSNGGVSAISVDLKAGSYYYYCTVPGHKAGGMDGRLTVK